MKNTYKYIVVFILLLANITSFSQKDSTKKERNYAIMPIISYNRSFGMQFGAMQNFYFNINKQDTISPSSVLGLFATVFTNKTMFVSMFNKSYFNENKWRTMTALGYGNIQFQTYISLENVSPVYAGNSELFIDYRTQVLYAYFEGMHKLFGKLYGGLRFVYSGIKTEFETLLPDEKLSLLGLGIAMEYDKRNSVFYPTTGFNFKLQTYSFSEKMASSETYNVLTMQLNKYFKVNTKAVFVLRLYSDMAFSPEEVPFNGKSVVGRDDIRGYTKGQYRANQIYDTQIEYRQFFTEKIGMVAFGGLAVATDDIKGTNNSGLLPAVGIGFRYKIIESKNINTGIDIAVGKEDWGIYFRIGEAFLR